MSQSIYQIGDRTLINYASSYSGNNHPINHTVKEVQNLDYYDYIYMILFQFMIREEGWDYYKFERNADKIVDFTQNATAYQIHLTKKSINIDESKDHCIIIGIYNENIFENFESLKVMYNAMHDNEKNDCIFNYRDMVLEIPSTRRI